MSGSERTLRPPSPLQSSCQQQHSRVPLLRRAEDSRPDPDHACLALSRSMKDAMDWIKDWAAQPSPAVRDSGRFRRPFWRSVTCFTRKVVTRPGYSAEDGPTDPPQVLGHAPQTRRHAPIHNETGVSPRAVIEPRRVRDTRTVQQSDTDSRHASDQVPSDISIKAKDNFTPILATTPRRSTVHYH